MSLILGSIRLGTMAIIRTLIQAKVAWAAKVSKPPDMFGVHVIEFEIIYAKLGKRKEQCDVSLIMIIRSLNQN
jgi:hypothetical protein